MHHYRILTPTLHSSDFHSQSNAVILSQVSRRNPVNIAPGSSKHHPNNFEHKDTCVHDPIEDHRNKTHREVPQDAAADDRIPEFGTHCFWCGGVCEGSGQAIEWCEGCTQTRNAEFPTIRRV